MTIDEFVTNHCQGRQYDSCVNSPCLYASYSGCTHHLHPKHAAGQQIDEQTARINSLTNSLKTITTREQFDAWMQKNDEERRRPGYFTVAAPSATEIQAQREMDAEHDRENTI